MDQTLALKNLEKESSPVERRPPSETPPVPTQPRPSIKARSRFVTGRRMGALAALDVTAVAWMTVAGEWFDHYRMLSLGGHHQIVAGLAVVSLLMLGGFAVSGRVTAVGLVVASALTAIALAGLLMIAGLVFLAGTTVGLMIKLLRR